jgi:hypothetical protein
MKCVKCGSENVTVTVEQISGKTKEKNMGCLWAMCRWTLIICTCGLWLLVGKRSKTGNTKFTSRSVCICQSCGNKWYI